MSLNPQNPFESYVVQASAGSGKTFQLSRRFVYLVATGSEPSEILTITFTKKAAKEMRERILELARELQTNEDWQTEFQSSLSRFVEESQKDVATLSAHQTAQKILHAQSELQITTIDSIFHDWFQRYYFDESRPVLFEKELKMPSSAERDQTVDQAWLKVCQFIQETLAKGEDQYLQYYLQENGLYSLKNRIAKLLDHETFLWLERHHDPQSGLPITQLPAAHEDLISSENVFDQIEESLRTLSETLKPELAEKVLKSIAAQDLEALRATPFIKQGGIEISGTYLRGKKREQFASEIENIEEALRAEENQKRLIFLNAQASLFKSLAEVFFEELQKQKDRREHVEYSDFTKSAYEILHLDQFYGARYLIQTSIKHVMIDEFQDTSHLQWDIFRSIIEELLSGEGVAYQSSSPPTCFIVGDAKQSIYGFREAEPHLLLEAPQSLAPQGVHAITLATSYRSAKGVLDYVNCFFRERMQEFPEHSSASSDGCFAAPQRGSIRLFDLVPKDDEGEEAERVAKYCRDMIDDKTNVAVMDKITGTWRTPKLSDIAILYRKGTRVEEFLEAFDQHDLPVILDREVPLSSYICWQDLKTLLEAAQFPREKVYVLSALKSSLLGLPDTTIWQSDLDAGYEEWLTALKPETSSEVFHFLLNIFEGKSLSQPATIVSDLLAIFRSNEVRSRYTETLPESSQREMVMQLDAILSFLMHCESEGIVTPTQLLEVLEEWYEGEHNLPPQSHGDSAIRMMTIHKSKGLEFPIVGLIDAGSRWEKKDPYWVRKKRGDEAGGLYYIGNKTEQPSGNREFDTIVSNVDREQIEESLRLVYVALTRAESHLFLSGTEPFRAAPESSVLDLALESLEDMSKLGYEISEGDSFKEIHFKGGTHKEKEQALSVSQTSYSDNAPRKHHLPCEIVSVKPSAMMNKDYKPVKQSLTAQEKEEKRLEGLFIHALIEQQITSHSEAQSLWEKTVQSHSQDHVFLKHDINAAFEEYQTFMQSSLWQELSAKGRLLHELPFSLLKENALYRGSIDLVVLGDDGRGEVIDFKTADEIESAASYREQLKIYQEACEGIFKDYQFQSFVVATKTLEILPVS